MISRSKLKESFEVDCKIGAFYSGGKIRWSEDGDTLFCCNSGAINVINLETGRPKLVLGDENEGADTVHCFTLNKSNDSVISSHRSGLFKIWSVTDGSVIKQWKNIHKGPVAELDISKDGNLLASGGSDSVIRIWDLIYHSCTHALKGAQGVISVLKFHQENEKNQIFGCGDDLKISCWDLNTSDLIFQLSGHFSKITSISFSYDVKYLASSGRDNVAMLWNLETKTAVKTYPVFESLEGVICLPKKFELPGVGEISKGVHVATAGEKGVIRIFDMLEGREIYSQLNSLVVPASEKGGLSITQLLYNANKNLLAVCSSEHNIIFHKLDTFDCVKQLIGFSDEILDIVCLGKNNSHLAVATNSCDIKLYDINNLNCQLVKGHTDLVLSLAVSPFKNKFMLSGAKDNTVRLWKLKKSQMICLAIGSRHSSSVTTLFFSQLSVDFFLSASEDTTLKLWTIQKEEKDYKISVKLTTVAHPKDINSVCISPNDKIVATGSQDKTVKLWSADHLSLLGTLTGHKRGVWCVRFSPVDQVLLSSSADCTIKLWAIATFECLKTFEGHESSVLRAEFATKGMQVVSGSGDGLLKLWTIKNGECAGTFDQHTGKIWALAVIEDGEKIITGGSDSLIVSWRDSTEEKREAALKQRQEELANDQLLSNLIKNNQLFAALGLALSLDRPLKVLTIIKDILKINKKEGLTDTIKRLTDKDKENLLNCASVWNCNSRNCDAAQLVISILLDEIACGDFKPTNLPNMVEEILPYTERHFKRLTQLLEDLHFLQFTMASMKPTLKS